jgi:hypothetical protein
VVVFRSAEELSEGQRFRLKLRWRCIPRRGEAPMGGAGSF